MLSTQSIFINNFHRSQVLPVSYGSEEKPHTSCAVRSWWKRSKWRNLSLMRLTWCHCNRMQASISFSLRKITKVFAVSRVKNNSPSLPNCIFTISSYFYLYASDKRSLKIDLDLQMVVNANRVSGGGRQRKKHIRIFFLLQNFRESALRDLVHCHKLFSLSECSAQSRDFGFFFLSFSTKIWRFISFNSINGVSTYRKIIYFINCIKMANEWRTCSISVKLSIHHYIINFAPWEFTVSIPHIFVGAFFLPFVCWLFSLSLFFPSALSFQRKNLTIIFGFIYQKSFCFNRFFLCLYSSPFLSTACFYVCSRALLFYLLLF